ncbi:MAG: hypothetical protein ACREJ6_11955, partial [Candidatus Methylomirabilis sp.]
LRQRKMGTPLGERGDIPVTWARPAGMDLRTHQFAPLTLDSNLAYIVSSASADFPVGVLINKPNSGEGATAVIEGMVEARAGATVTGGRYVKISNGWFVAANSGDRASGKSFSTAASGGVFTIQIIPTQITLTTSFAP